MHKKHTKVMMISALALALGSFILVFCGIPVRANSYDQLKWGFIDRTGKIRFAPKSEESSGEFTDGLCDVQLEHGRFIIDHTGKKICHIQKNAGMVSLGGGTAIVPVGQKSCMLDSNGKKSSAQRLTPFRAIRKDFGT